MSKFANLFLMLAVFACGIAVGHVFGAGAVVQAQSDKRVFELRTYTASEGKLSDLQARFRNHTTALFKKHGITNVGYGCRRMRHNRRIPSSICLRIRTVKRRRRAGPRFGPIPPGRRRGPNPK